MVVEQLVEVVKQVAEQVVDRTPRLVLVLHTTAVLARWLLASSARTTVDATSYSATYTRTSISF